MVLTTLIVGWFVNNICHTGAEVLVAYGDDNSGSCFDLETSLCRRFVSWIGLKGKNSSFSHDSKNPALSSCNNRQRHKGAIVQKTSGLKGHSLYPGAIV